MTDEQGPQQPSTPQRGPDFPESPAPSPTEPLPTAPSPAAPSAAARRPGRGAGGLWDGALSSTGGRVAVVLAALFVTLFLVGGLGLSALAVGRRVLGEDHGPMMSQGRDGPWNGMGRGNGQSNGDENRHGDEKGKGNGPGPGRDQGLGHGWGNGNGTDRGVPEGTMPGIPRGEGFGHGGFGPGGALHGEVTAAGVGGQVVTTVFQLGEVTAYTPGRSVAVKSTDGFTATYTITADTGTARGGTPVLGAKVRVIAAKDGLALTRIAVVGQPQG
ncbi:MAG: hypothetical protein ABIU87_05255 [Ornithinibacter sp.]